MASTMKMQRASLQKAGSVRSCSISRRPAAAAVAVRAQATAVAAAAKVSVTEHGSVSLRGTVRKVNEDRIDVKVGQQQGAWGQSTRLLKHLRQHICHRTSFECLVGFTRH